MERKGSSASSRHRHGKVVAIVQQSDTTASCCAVWLKGIWLLIAFPVPPSTDGAAASAALHDTEIALLSRQSVSVRDPNE